MVRWLFLFKYNLNESHKTWKSTLSLTDCCQLCFNHPPNIPAHRLWRTTSHAHTNTYTQTHSHTETTTHHVKLISVTVQAAMVCGICVCVCVLFVCAHTRVYVWYALYFYKAAVQPWALLFTINSSFFLSSTFNAALNPHLTFTLALISHSLFFPSVFTPPLGPLLLLCCSIGP